MLANPGLKKRAYGKIDNEILVKAIVAGKTYREAGILAGSEAKDGEQIKQGVYKKISRNPTIKKNIIDQLEAKRQLIIDNIKETDIKKAPFGSKVVAMGIITDKIQLLRGDPTQIVKEMPKMVIEDSKTTHQIAPGGTETPKQAYKHLLRAKPEQIGLTPINIGKTPKQQV